MTDPAADIIDLYQRHSHAWVSARQRQAHLYEREWFARFRQLLGPAATVLDLGCGAGVPLAAHLVEHGCTVTGVDSSPAMLELFRQQVPGQPTVLADMRQLALAQTFSGILGWDSFFHLTPQQQRSMFPIFRHHAGAGAALMFTSGPAHGEVVGELEGDPLYHASLDPHEYRQLLQQYGFEVVAHQAEDPVCRRTVWLARRI